MSALMLCLNLEGWVMSEISILPYKPPSITEPCKHLEGILYQDWMSLASGAEIL
jgi:hypothetical protein